MNATKREKMDVESLTRQLETGRTKATLELQASENYFISFVLSTTSTQKFNWKCVSMVLNMPKRINQSGGDFGWRAFHTKAGYFPTLVLSRIQMSPRFRVSRPCGLLH